MGNATLLTELNLSENLISGHIPSSIVMLSNLTSLNVAVNLIDGVLPEQLVNLYSLKELNISYLFLHGSLPPYLPSSLEVLSIIESGLSGFLPDSFQYLSNLRSLVIVGNRFQGAFPYFDFMRNLTTLEIRDNKFESTYLPEGLGARFMLKTLRISGEKISRIPYIFSRLPYLEVLDLSNNGLQDYILDEIGSLPSLRHLNMSNNYLYGSIPATIGYSYSLQVLDLSNNNLGGIPNIPSPPMMYSCNLMNNTFACPITYWSNERCNATCYWQ